MKRTLGLTVALSALYAVPAAAQVVEPNGEVVPVLIDGYETTLQQFFDAEGESLSAVDAASPEPGVFSPRCDFEAALVLSQSGAEAGISWYNVPADPTSAPVEIFEIVPPGATLDEIIASADIRSHPSYGGGDIGFVLTKYGTRAYYSEYQRNALCTECTTPGYWVMALVYRSTLDANTYYLAFEDWEGADDRSWGQNDGDFNDKVFRFTGVSCVGGGVPCDTGLIGMCAAGLTECVMGGALECRQQIQASAEVCDNVDNDCNGVVDDGEGLCPVGEVCDRGVCRPNCSGGEFPCNSPLVCHPESGLCVEPLCLDVTCEVGTVCVGGNCVGACDGVVCPLGQQCQLGRCVDLCAGVVCRPGDVCENGVCVGSCSCRGCDAPLVCAPSGECVDAGCETQSCPDGEVCQAGACVDACVGAQCPGSAPCAVGQCGDPALSDPGGTGGAPGGGTGGITVGTGGAVATGGRAASGGAVSTGGSSQTPAAQGSGADEPGCGCRTPPSPSRTASIAGVLFVLATWFKRRRVAGML